MLAIFARASRRFLSSSAVVPALSDADVTALSNRLAPLAAAAAADHFRLVELRSSSHLNALQAERLKQTSPIAQYHDAVNALQQDVDEVASILSDPAADEDLLTLAREESAVLEHRTAITASHLINALLRAQSSPELENASSAILEIRAGTGGDEAALFVSDLMQMYQRLASRKRWRVRTLSVSETALRGFREVILRISGNTVYDTLRIEAGVHRVQRVPTTETQGRVHTSTASLSVLRDDTTGKPVNIDLADVRIDVYRASGAGGQHVNTTESAVRATHIPTGLVATSQEDRSQHRNRAIALESLAARLAAKQAADALAARTSERRAQLGSSLGERSDRIRTYNFPQRRVTDHRVTPNNALLSVVPSAKNAVGDKSAPLDSVLEGGPELDRLMGAVRRAQEVERLEQLLSQAEEHRKDQDQKQDLAAKS